MTDTFILSVPAANDNPKHGPFIRHDGALTDSKVSARIFCYVDAVTAVTVNRLRHGQVFMIRVSTRSVVDALHEAVEFKLSEMLS